MDLNFSKDTVYLDTIFTNIGSSTYNLKVYNNSQTNILIPKIKLQNLDQDPELQNLITLDGTLNLIGKAKGAGLFNLEQDLELQNLKC